MSDKAGKEVDDFYTRPPKLSTWVSFKTFLWNSETSQFLGRTCASWAKILLFYLLFYLGLAGFFSALLALFFQTIDLKTPKWQLTSGLIGDNPGLGFRPMPPESHVESTLIWFKLQDENYAPWTNKLDDFLTEYRDTSADLEKYREDCPLNASRPSKDKVCRVKVEAWSPCTKHENYNYHEGNPCIFLKLNKIFGWEPEFYNDTTSLPSNMPKDLQDYIKKKSKTATHLNTVWVSCEGENPADIENIGNIHYMPSRGFPGHFFPYKNDPGYMAPLMAVWFEKPAYGVLINIECKAWARNIHHDRAERRGSVHFELMIDQ